MAVILIVDDDPDIAEALALALEDERHTAITATTADDALALAGSEQPDLILLDYHMPGAEPMRLIAELRGVASARIVLATGQDLAEEDLRTLGADRLLRKPFSIEGVLELLQADVRPPPAP